jgi:hypothetical protein
MDKTERKKLGLIDLTPKRVGFPPEGLNERQLALRQAIVNRFTSNKIKRFIAEQTKYINFHQHIAEGTKILFDERGNPPPNAPIESIIEAREQLESQVTMLEAICSAMRNNIVQIKEIEDAAFAMLGEAPDART